MIKLILPGCKTYYSGYYTITYKSIGLLYCVNVRVKGKRDLSFRITSKFKNFSELYSIDYLPKNQKVSVGIRIKDQKNDDSSTCASKIIYHLVNGQKHPLQEGISTYDIQTWIALIAAILPILMILYFYVVAMIKWYKETVADGTFENQVNKKLFDGQTGKEPEFDIYNNLIKSIEMLIKTDKVKSVLICGIPGTSKTHIVRRTLYFNGLQSGRDYTIIKGSSMGMIDFVSALYNNSKKIVVLDDFDSPLNDADTVNILKSATDSYSKRIISFPRAKMLTAGAGGSDYNIPQKFEFSGKLIIITNKKFKEIDKAFISRCLTLEVNFTPEEFLKNIETMLKYIMPEIDMELKLEVFGYVQNLAYKENLKGLNFRTFQSAVSIRMLYPDNWKEMIKYVLK